MNYETGIKDSCIKFSLTIKFHFTSSICSRCEVSLTSKFLVGRRLSIARVQTALRSRGEDSSLVCIYVKSMHEVPRLIPTIREIFTNGPFKIFVLNHYSHLIQIVWHEHHVYLK